MKRYQQISEKYFTTTSLTGGFYGAGIITLESFINPSLIELKKLLKEHYELRGVVNQEGHIIVWRPDALHNDVIDKLKKEDKDFNRLFKGNSYSNRNYITIIINRHFDIFLGDGEYIPDIIKDDKVNISLLFKNMLKKQQLDISNVLQEQLDKFYIEI